MSSLRMPSSGANVGGRALVQRAARHGRRRGSVMMRAEAGTAPEAGVIILPGLGNNVADYADLTALLEERGLAVGCADVGRLDWGRNAAGLRYPEYWQGTLNPRPTVDWYLNKVEAAVDELKRETDGAPITLLTHSAGGWLGRLYMKDFGTSGIRAMVSLGSPHQPPPPGVVDQTRGILTFCANECPGAYHDDVEYVTVAGRWLQGAPLRGEGTIKQKIIGAGYQTVCGRADAWGDGVVPQDVAHLEGATQIDLEGVYHTVLGKPADEVWYGSPEIIDEWADHLLPAAEAPKAGAFSFFSALTSKFQQ